MQPNETKKKLSPAIISCIVVVLLAIAASGAYAITRSGKTATNTDSNVVDANTESIVDGTTTDDLDTTPDTNDDATSGTESTTTSAYTDGTYTETGSYSTPEGTESITVTATLSAGTVTNISAKGSASNSHTKEHQSQFLSAYKSLVVGKSIDSIKLSRVAGSSLTSNGFNAALAKIKSDATS